MSPVQQVLDYRREIDENQKQIREMGIGFKKV